MSKLSSSQTSECFKKLVDAAMSNKHGSSFDAAVFAVAINMNGDTKTTDEFLAVRGMLTLLKTVLPESQHKIGHLSRYSN